METTPSLRPDELVARLKSRVDEVGSNEKQLAESSGVARSTLQRRFLDPTAFTISELTAIATALDTTVEYLTLGISEAVSA